MNTKSPGILKLLFIVPLFLLFLLSKGNAFATSGCCSWHGGESYCDYSVNRWVCADGTYSPSCTCGSYAPAPVYYPVYYPVYVPPPAPKAPSMTANFTFEPNTNQTYNVLMKWSHVNNTGFSLALHNVPGGDPGPLTDTSNDYFTFYNVSPGTYYVDMKVGINGTWSTITYWKVEVPAWIPPSPTLSPTIDTTSVTNNAENKSIISSFFDWLFGLFKNNNSSTQTDSTPQSKYTCDCSKTCTQISSCDEAYYQLNHCGCSVRDGDGDGIPCENLCQ